MDSKPAQVVAALVTGRGSAAISSIQVFGPGAGEVLDKIFREVSQKPERFSVGRIYHGHIIDSAGEVVDEVVLGCEGEGDFCISCHGNVLIVEEILELLKSAGAGIVDPEEIIELQGRTAYGDDTISVEAQMVMARVTTADGARIVAHQRQMGLKQACKWLLDNIDVMDSNDIAAVAKEILRDSRVGKYFIEGARVVLAGPPNSGKSTIFNKFCGREKAIVTDLAGTTRDWLSGCVRLSNIFVEIFDTAGLDESLALRGSIDLASQNRAKELLASADLVVAVFDGSRDIKQQCPCDLADRLVVFNKSDLGVSESNRRFEDAVVMSAENDEGITKLAAAIEEELGLSGFDMQKTVCFTDRQFSLMEQVSSSRDKEKIRTLITELLSGEISV